MTANRVSQLLDDIRLLDEQRHRLVLALRQAVLGLDPAITEEVKYGGVLFSAAKPFCGIFSYSKHVSLEFGDGAALPDPHAVLEGEGKLRRHIKLSTIDDISAKHVRAYLELAFKAATCEGASGWLAFDIGINKELRYVPRQNSLDHRRVVRHWRGAGL